MEIWTGIWILVRFLPTALIIFAGVMIIELGIEFIQKKKIEVKILNWLCQFLWIRIVVSILKITGIIGGSFGISSPLDSYISFKLFEDGFNAATILNICLFVPYGFLPVFIFKNIHKHWWNGVILGAVFSIGIEFLQTFLGRFEYLWDSRWIFDRMLVTSYNHKEKINSSLPYLIPTGLEAGTPRQEAVPKRQKFSRIENLWPRDDSCSHEQ